MKLTAQQLKEMVRNVVSTKMKNLGEAASTVPKAEDIPKDVVAFATKIDTFLKKTIKEARKLAEEGEDAMKANVLSDWNTQERNRFLLYRIGLLKALANHLVSKLEEELWH
jgi:hypothetical protein